MTKCTNGTNPRHDFLFIIKKRDTILNSLQMTLCTEDRGACHVITKGARNFDIWGGPEIPLFFADHIVRVRKNMLACPRYRSKNMIRVRMGNEHDIYFGSFYSSIGQMFYEQTRTWP